MASPTAERERIGGIENLRRGFLLLFGASAIDLFLALFSLSAYIRGARATAVPRSLAVWGLAAGLLALTLFILGILSWVFRIIGWGKLCRGVGKRFYCYVRIILVLLPILGTIVVAATIALLIVKMLSLGPTMSVWELEKAKGLVIYFALGLALMTASFIIEGVALLDFSYVLESRLLRNGGALYIVANVLSVLNSVTGMLKFAPIVKSVFNILSSILAVVSALMLYWALRAGGES